MINSSALGPLLEHIRALEQEVATALGETEQRFRYKLTAGRARFKDDDQRQDAHLRTSLPRYIYRSRLSVALSAPLIYACAVPFGLLDLFVSVYQAVCFPICGIPKVRRQDCFLFDRARLRYLNLLERLNCLYCSYVNGLCAYVTEIAARTEQHWCPIRHRRQVNAPHSRYSRFLEYGDAEAYNRRLEELRHDFADLRESNRMQP